MHERDRCDGRRRPRPTSATTPHATNSQTISDSVHAVTAALMAKIARSADRCQCRPDELPRRVRR